MTDNVDQVHAWGRRPLVPFSAWLNGELPDFDGALRGVYARDYNYDMFWVVFPVKRGSSPGFIEAGKQATLTVRVAGKEGRVQFTAPETYAR